MDKGGAQVLSQVRPLETIKTPGGCGGQTPATEKNFRFWGAKKAFSLSLGACRGCDQNNHKSKRVTGAYEAGPSTFQTWTAASYESMHE